jgi:hypothetical protein
MNILLRLVLILYRIKKQLNFENAEMLFHRTKNDLNATFLIKITLGSQRGNKVTLTGSPLFFKVTLPIYLIPSRRLEKSGKIYVYTL